MKIKAFLLRETNIERNSYIWNMAGSLLMAFQSVIMLMILTRTLGLMEAGVFTIAYASANLFLTIGKYGMRYFQVSDVKKQFTFADYKMSRVVSVSAMIGVSALYVAYASASNGYTLEKTQVIIWMCLFKAVDAIEDVYLGLYQQKNRLDVASRIMALRIGITIIIFGVGLVVFNSLLLALITATASTVLLFLLFTRWTIGTFRAEEEDKKADKKRLLLLLRRCFPLCAGSFLSFYIGNAPKYAIDAMLSDELQACYGFIAMPVFVIGLLNNFIFNPMLYHLSVLWNDRKVKQFALRTAAQMGIVAAITIVCIGGAYLLGVPVLSWLYNTDLAPYKMELLVLLLGGGFLGMSGLLNAVITIIRYQQSLMWGYAFVAVLAYMLSDRIVGDCGMMGAAALYTALMGILCLVFFLVFLYGIMKKKNSLQ